MSADVDSLLIFTDGACTGNPGPGGWASILAFPTGHVRELGGNNPQTTNNRMELVGALRALASLKSSPTSSILLYTDSTYVIRGITEWIFAWKTRNWHNAEGLEVSNRDLWEELLKETMRLKPAKISWRYVRGHTGVPGNERCDAIAVAFANGKKINLYDGPLMGYRVPIHDLPADHEVPEMKTQEKKAPAYSYLSYFGGTVMRHLTWNECERRVKGQSGAKFKKAMSQQDEGEILRGWGLDPETTVIKE